MIRWLLLAFAALVAGTFFYQQIASGSGYILISLGNTSVEMSFWTGVFLLVAGLLTVYGIYRLLSGSFRAVASGAQRVRSGSSRNVQRRTARGLIDFIEGNWKQARKHLLKTAKKADYPLINYLAAARSTFELGNHEEATELLHQAEQSSPESGLAVALTQARMLLSDKKYERCIANLERAKKISPLHPVVLDLLQQTYVLLEDWRSLKKLLPDLRRYKILSEPALTALELRLHRALLLQAGEKARRLTEGDATAVLKAEWDAVPRPYRRQVEVVKAYAEQLISVGNESAAESALRKELNHEWSDALIALYGRVQGKDVKRQLLVAENWLKERPGNADLQLALGRLCLRNEQWNRAREYFENSLKLQKSPETYAELARLLAHLGEHQSSTEYYQRGLSLTTAGLPDLPMPSANPNPAPLRAAAP